MNAEELFELLGSLEAARDAGAKGNGLARSVLLSGVEYGHARETGERKLRATWKKRVGTGPAPLVLIADNPGREELVCVFGPDRQGPIRSVRTASLRELIASTDGMGDLEAVRRVAHEIEHLDAERVAGLSVRGLGTDHLYSERLPGDAERWAELAGLAPDSTRTDWREVLAALGYELERLSDCGYLARAGDRPVLVVHPKRSAAEFSRLDRDGRPPERALLAACSTHGAPYGLLAAGPRMRLLRASAEEGGSAANYLELDAGLIEDEARPLLGLLSPAYLADGGFAGVLADGGG